MKSKKNKKKEVKLVDYTKIIPLTNIEWKMTLLITLETTISMTKKIRPVEMINLSDCLVCTECQRDLPNISFKLKKGKLGCIWCVNTKKEK